MTVHTTQPTLLSLFEQAYTLAKVNRYLGYGAIVCFCVFGTLGSMARFADSMWVYFCFYYLPYGLIGLGVPISLYHGFILARYRVVQKSILMTVFLVAFGLVAVAGLGRVLGDDVMMAMAGFLALIAWFVMPFLFGANIRRYLDFLYQYQKT